MARSYRPGIDAARWLLDELVQRLGVEAEWSAVDTDSLRWSAGSFCTLFTVADTSVHTPHLARLTIATDAAFDGDPAAATNVTNGFNGVTGLVRWVVRPDETEGEFTVAVVSSFLVTPGTVSALLPLVEAAVREQVAVVTAKMTNEANAMWGGEAAVVEGEDGPRPPQVWNRVVRHFDDAVTPFVDDPSDAWDADVAAVWAELDAEMDAYPVRWTGEAEPDQLTVAIPLRQPAVTDGEGDRTLAAGAEFYPLDALPTAPVRAAAERNPVLGNGLLVVLVYPGVYADADRAAERAAAFNLRSVERPSVGHLLGAWSARGEELYWTAFLPASLHRQFDVETRRLAVRDLLSSASREAQLARCLDDGDDSTLIGFERFTDLLGPAYGEESDAVDLPLGVLDRLSRELAGPSGTYLVDSDDGFTWWPGGYPQTVRVMLAGPSAGRSGPVAVEVSSKVRRGLKPSVAVLGTLARMGERLRRCRLVLLEDGSVDLHAVVSVRAGSARTGLARVWEQATEQCVLAERMAPTVARLGGSAPPSHPTQGTRVDRARLLTMLPLVRENAEKATAVAGASLALALGYLLAPALGILDHDPGRTLTFCWRPSTVPSPSPPVASAGNGDPLLRTVVRVGADPAVGPGILVRTVVPSAGNPATKAAWCNRANLEAVAAGVPSPGGFGLNDEGQVLLTGWLGAGAFGDDPARSLGVLLHAHQRTIVDALLREPGFASGAPLRVGELDRLIATLPAALRSVLAVPAGTTGGASAVPGTPASLLLRMECPAGPAGPDDQTSASVLPVVGSLLPGGSHAVAVTVDRDIPRFGDLALLWSWLLDVAGVGQPDAAAGDGWPDDPAAERRWAAETVAAALADLVREGALVPATSARPLTEQPMVGPGGTVVTVEVNERYDLELVVRLREEARGASLVAQPDAEGATLRVGLPVITAGWSSTEAVVAATRTLVEQVLRQASG